MRQSDRNEGLDQGTGHFRAPRGQYHRRTFASRNSDILSRPRPRKSTLLRANAPRQRPLTSRSALNLPPSKCFRIYVTLFACSRKIRFSPLSASSLSGLGSVRRPRLYPRQRPLHQAVALPSPAHLVLLFEHFKDQHLDTIPVSPPEFLEYKAQLKSFNKLAAFDTATFNLSEGELRSFVGCFGAKVSADLFPLLGVGSNSRPDHPPPEECAVGRDDVIVISERLWRRKFDRDPRVLGGKLMADGRAFTVVVGIMPASFEFPLPLL